MESFKIWYLLSESNSMEWNQKYSNQRFKFEMYRTNLNFSGQNDSFLVPVHGIIEESHVYTFTLVHHNLQQDIPWNNKEMNCCSSL